MPHQDTVIQTATGALRGELRAELSCFHAVPYAAAPIGPLRFAPPQPVTEWTGVRDATRSGPIAPQPPSRLNNVMGGDTDRVQSEDCLTLTIWTPQADARRRPVLVWLHGGGFATGAGDLDCYDGARLAREGDMVVVAVNYRQGALGFLYAQGVSPGNLGLMDQVAAFEWIQANIENFGGDPGQITAMGQSGGGMSIALLLTRTESSAFAQRAILMSAPLGLTCFTPQTAQLVGNAFLTALGIEPDAANALDLARQAPIEAIMKAQGVAGQYYNSQLAQPGAVTPPFIPVTDGHFLPNVDHMPASFAQAAGKVDCLIGTTRDEASAFYFDQPTAAAMATESRLASEAEPWRKRRPDASPQQILNDRTTEEIFERPSTVWADNAAAAQRKAYLYRFDWAAPASKYGATHCIDLPFVFGTRQAFASAPMMAGFDLAQVETLSAQVRASWIGYVRSGDPTRGLPPTWAPRSAQNRSRMLFDAPCELDVGGSAFGSKS